jgi:hypothetical protein
MAEEVITPANHTIGGLSTDYTVRVAGPPRTTFKLRKPDGARTWPQITGDFGGGLT